MHEIPFKHNIVKKVITGNGGDEFDARVAQKYVFNGLSYTMGTLELIPGKKRIYVVYGKETGNPVVQ